MRGGERREEMEIEDADALVRLSQGISGLHELRDHICIVHWLFFNG